MKTNIFYRVIGVLGFLLLLTSQSSQFKQTVDYSQKLQVLSFEELLDLQQFIIQLLGNQKDLSSIPVLSDKNIDALRNPFDFKNEIDPLLNKSLVDALAGPENVDYIKEIIQDIDSCQLRDWTRSRFENGQIGLGDLFEEIEEKVRNDYEKIKNEDKAKGGILIDEAFHYNRILIYRRVLYPVLIDLIESVQEIEDKEKKYQKVIEVYIKARSDEYLIKSTIAFFQKYNDHPIVEILLPDANQRKRLFSQIVDYNKTEQILLNIVNTDEEKARVLIEQYEKQYTKAKFETRAEILKTIKEIVNHAAAIIAQNVRDFEDFQKIIEEEARAVGDTVIASIEDAILKSPLGTALKVANQQAHNFTLNNGIGLNYLDFQKPLEETEDYQIWARLRFPEIDWALLCDTSITKVERTTPQLSLVIVPRIGSEYGRTKFEIGSTGITDRLYIDSVNAKINDVFLEIPLHLSISDVTVYKQPAKASSTKFFTSKDERLKDYRIGLELADIGLYARFDYELTYAEEIAAQLNLPKALGIGLEKVGLVISDDNEWDVELFFKWYPQGVFKDIADFHHEASTIKVKLSEIQNYQVQTQEYLQDAKDVLRFIIMDKVVEELNEIAQEYKTKIAPYLLADSIDMIKISTDTSRGMLMADITLQPIGINTFEIDDALKTISVTAQMSFENGRPVFKVSKPTVPLASYTRKLIREKWLREQREGIIKLINENDALNLENLDEGKIKILTDNIILNVSQDIRFDDFIIDLKKKSICSAVRLDNGSLNQSFCLSESGFEADWSILGKQIKRQLWEYIEDNIITLIENYVIDMVSTPISDFVNSYCDKTETIEFDFFGIPFKTEGEVSCQDGVARVNAQADISTLNFIFEITVSIDASGNVKVEYVDPEQLIQALMNRFILNNDNIPRDVSFLKLRNERLDLNAGLLTIDIYAVFPFFTQEIIIGDITVNKNGGVEFNGDRDITYSLIQDAINDKLRGVDLSKFKIDFGKFAGLDIVDSPSIELSRDIQGLKLDAKAYLAYGGLEIEPIGVYIDLKNDLDIKVEFDRIKIKEGLFQELNKILSNAYNIGGVLSVKPRINGVTLDPIGITGMIDIDVPKMFNLPPIEFWITQHGFKFGDIQPVFPLPMPIYTPSGIVFCNPNANSVLGPEVHFDLDNKIVKFLTAATFLERPNANILKIMMEARIELEDDLIIAYEGDLIAGSFLTLMSGDGKLNISDLAFTMNERTTGLVRNIIKYDKQVDIQPKEKSASANADVECLGINFSVELGAEVYNDQLDLESIVNTDFDFLGGSLSLKASTSIIPQKPTSPATNANVRLNGGFVIDNFEIAGVNIDSRIDRTKVGFKALGMRLGFTAPNIKSISEEDFLELIIDLWSDIPEAILELLKDPTLLTRVEIKAGPTSFENGDRDGNGDRDRDEESGGSTNRDLGTSPYERPNPGDAKFPTVLEPCESPPCATTEQSELSQFLYSLKGLGEFSNSTQIRFRNREGVFQCFPKSNVGVDDFTMIVDTEYERTSNGNLFTLRDIILEPVGGKEGKFQNGNAAVQQNGCFLLRKKIPINIYEDEEGCWLSLRDQGYEDVLGSNEFRKSIRCDIPEYLAPTHYANLKAENNQVWLFISVGLFDSGNFCGQNRSRLTKRRREISFSELTQNPSQIDTIECDNCSLYNIDEDGITLENRGSFVRNIEGVCYYRKRGRQDQRSSINEYQNFSKIKTSTSFLRYIRSRTGIRNNRKNKSIIRSFVSYGNIGVTGDELFIPISGNKMLRINQNSRVYIYEALNELSENITIQDQVCRLSGEVWHEIEVSSFKGFFPSISPTKSAEQFVTEIGANKEIYSESITQFGNYLKYYIQFGVEPEFEYVEIADPKCSLITYQYPQIEETARWEVGYTYRMPPPTESPYKFKDDSYRLQQSPLMDSLEVGSTKTQQRELLQNNGHIFKNFLFNRIAGNLGNYLLYADNSQLTYISSLEDSLHLSIYRTDSLEAEVRKIHQLHFLGDARLSEGAGREEFLPNVQSNNAHQRFFNKIFTAALDHHETTIYVGRFPFDDNFFYRAVIFTHDGNVELIWEKPGNNDLQSVKRSKAQINEQIERARRVPSHYPRIMKSLVNQRAKAEFLLSGFDGYNEWWKANSIRVHPFYLFN
jgi:hypothetical protein